VDGDGVVDLAVGAHGDDDGGFGKGAVWILFLRPDGTVKTHQKISATAGNFTGPLNGTVLFGSSVTGLGDLDGDGVRDAVVSAPWDNAGGPQTGAIWILFLNSNGTVKTHQKISDVEGGFAGDLDSGDLFGRSLACLGDIGGDGSTELAVGAVLDDDGGSDHGAVWILTLNNDGTVQSHSKISSTQGGFTGQLDVRDQLGISLTPLGDLDCDGTIELAVGANTDDDGGFDRGAVWVLFLNLDGTVSSHQKISDTEGNFSGVLDDGDLFGISVASMGDMDGDGGTDLAVGATDDDDGGAARGAVWTLFLDGCTASSVPTISSPPPFAVRHNHPNPFGPQTTVDFTLHRDAHVLLTVYDVSGALVETLIDRRMFAGDHFVQWDGHDSAGNRVTSGVYFYRLTAANSTITRKAVLLR
jgi:hypothetical protein